MATNTTSYSKTVEILNTAKTSPEEALILLSKDKQDSLKKIMFLVGVDGIIGGVAADKPEDFEEITGLLQQMQ